MFISSLLKITTAGSKRNVYPDPVNLVEIVSSFQALIL